MWLAKTYPAWKVFKWLHHIEPVEVHCSCGHCVITSIIQCVKNQITLSVCRRGQEYWEYFQNSWFYEVILCSFGTIKHKFTLNFWNPNFSPDFLAPVIWESRELGISHLNFKQFHVTIVNMWSTCSFFNAMLQTELNHSWAVSIGDSIKSGGIQSVGDLSLPCKFRHRSTRKTTTSIWTSKISIILRVKGN